MNGLPYMGSKRKIAPQIVKAIVSRHPAAVNFYDVFGGEFIEIEILNV